MKMETADTRKGGNGTQHFSLPRDVRQALELTSVQRGRLELLEAGEYEQYLRFEELRRVEAEEIAKAAARTAEIETLRERVAYLESLEEGAGKRALWSALGGGAYGVLIGMGLGALLTPKPTLKGLIRDKIADWLF